MSDLEPDQPHHPKSRLLRISPESNSRFAFLVKLSMAQWWVVSAGILGFYLLGWWLHLRPGIFSDDSAYYLNQVLSGDLTNLKPFLYTRFLQFATLNGAVLELAAIVQALLLLLAFSRMFAIAFVTRTRVAWLAMGALLLLNPYAANMIFYIQNDVLFSVAMMLIAVETLNIVRQRSVSFASSAMIALFAPMALLFRQNGLLFLPLWLATIFILLPRRQSWHLALPVVVTSLVASLTIIGVSRGNTDEQHDALYPAVIHEVVNLARPGYRTAIGTRLAPETRAAVGAERLPLAVAYYWPLYWDSIAFFPGGPRLVNLSEVQRDTIVRSFLQHDFLPNAHSVLAHRTEIFLGACLARAEPAPPYWTPLRLPQKLAASKKRSAVMEGDASLLGRVNDWSMQSRHWTWNALFGVVVLGLLSVVGLWRRDVPLLLCTLLFWVQAGAVFLAAPSADYRYVFVLYLVPLLLLVGQPLAHSAVREDE